MTVRTSDTHADRDTAEEGTGGSGDPVLSHDETLEILSNRRRRFALHYLKRRRGESVPLRDLSERVASWEYGKPVDALDYSERKRVQNALRQFHLPKMEELGFVEFTADGDAVRLTEMAAAHDFYVDVLPTRDVPWGAYYLLLSGFCVVVVAGAWLDVFPFSAPSPLSLAAILTVALTASSFVHFYDTYYCMRLGARKDPPGVEMG